MSLNVQRFRRRLQRSELYIGESERQRQATLQNFQNDFTRQLAAERAFQAAIETCTGMAAHIVSVYQLGHPQESRDVFRLLAEAGYLDDAFGQQMIALVAVRNRLVHLYWDLDIVRLHQCLQEDTLLLRRFRDGMLQILTAEEEAERDQAAD